MKKEHQQMARPTTKTNLLEAATGQFVTLWQLINSMSENEQNATFLFEDRDKNLRDILVHLFEWHQLLLNWADANLHGESKSFLPEPYNWKTYPKMNIGFWEKHQNTSYVDAKEVLQKSHSKVIELIESFSNEELFEKKHFPWTGTTSLGSYCVSATSSHYDWAIKKHLKVYREAGL